MVLRWKEGNDEKGALTREQDPSIPHFLWCFITLNIVKLVLQKSDYSSG